ncbi:archease [Streptomyces sp. WAC05374]|uniref:archease n=1 Tax=unclassified Streptomyces TaxID=2593676 RepID=UPI000F85C4F7|nr:archease [Streptomyces sp. WAC05374]RST03296.1 archease [Streptomyces sp. WAC05374]TDF54803.1 archease [Streptomyces sp. WAC05374]TDF56438.1 archease [Streptomyces sp. WAC05374]
MAGDTDDDGLLRRPGASGHRAVPHTADVRVEAWGASREQCLVEAVLGMVECFADVSGARATAVRQVQVGEGSDDDVLATLLDEVVFRLEVHGDVPVDVEVETVDDGLDVRMAVTDVRSVPMTGAVPKAVSWHELHLAPGPYGWSCAVTVDV